MRITNIADMRELARRRLPRFVFDYVEGGGYEEETLERNRADIRSIRLLPKNLNDVSSRNLYKTILGESVSMPVALAPIGAGGFTWPNGEAAAARAAAAFGVPYCLSTLSIATIEDVAEASRRPFWFQLYDFKDKRVSEGLVERAKQAGCSVLVLTVDGHVRSQRHREQKGGFNAPLRPTLSMAMQSAVRPSWLLRMLRSRRRTFGNLVGLVEDASNVGKMSSWIARNLDPTLGTKDIERWRRNWPGKLLVKGIMHPDDAASCVSAGADGVVVSNHGGRQVDGVTSSAAAIGAVADAIKGRGEVLVDGGIRSGIDVLKVLALGADACMVGRAYVYGMAAAGETGVGRALEILRNELDENMALCGISDVDDVGPGILASG